MAQARVGVRVADDRKSVTVELGPVEGASSPVGLDLEQLTKVINLLGQARRRMLEGLRVEPLDGKTVRTVAKPMWYVQVAQIDGSLLAFDHPDYGPVAFAIPRNDVAEIVRILGAHLALPTGHTDKPS
jgi:DNA polymerase III sliding clamp (beta) subunit (PCNA family)